MSEDNKIAIFGVIVYLLGVVTISPFAYLEGRAVREKPEVITIEVPTEKPPEPTFTIAATNTPEKLNDYECQLETARKQECEFLLGECRGLLDKNFNLLEDSAKKITNLEGIVDKLSKQGSDLYNQLLQCQQ